MDIDFPRGAGDAIGVLAEFQCVRLRGDLQSSDAATGTDPREWCGAGEEDALAIGCLAFGLQPLPDLASSLAHGVGEVPGIERIDLKHAQEASLEERCVAQVATGATHWVAPARHILRRDRHVPVPTIERDTHGPGHAIGALLERTSRIGADIAVAGGIDHSLGQNDGRPGFGVENHALDHAFFKDCTSGVCEMEDLDICGRKQLVPDQLDGFRVC